MVTKGARKTTGDYNAKDVGRLNDAVELSGNLVESYRRHANGKSCVVFTVTVAHSLEIAKRYNEEGIPAIHLDGKTPDKERADIPDKLRFSIECQVPYMVDL